MLYPSMCPHLEIESEDMPLLINHFIKKIQIIPEENKSKIKSHLMN